MKEKEIPFIETKTKNGKRAKPIKKPSVKLNFSKIPKLSSKPFLRLRGKFPLIEQKGTIVQHRKKFLFPENRSDHFRPQGTSINEQNLRGEQPDFSRIFFKKLKREIEEQNNLFLFS